MVKTQTRTLEPSLYERDFVLWTEQQAEALRAAATRFQPEMDPRSISKPDRGDRKLRPLAALGVPESACHDCRASFEARILAHR